MKHLINLLCFLSTMMLIACTDVPEPALRIGTNLWPGYVPLYLAQERGDLASDKVHLVEFSSASQVMQAYRNDLLDAAAVTLDEALLLLDNGEELKIVLVLDISNGADAIIGRPGVSKLADIKDKRIGLENNALGAYVISRALEIAKLDQESITIIPLEINEQEQAFKKNEIDAVVTFEPIISKLIKEGGNSIFDSSQIPGEIVDVLVVKNEILSQFPEKIKYVRDGWYRTLEFIKAQPRDAAKLLGTRMQLSVEETLSVYETLKLPGENENLRLLNDSSDSGLLESARKMRKIMLKNGLIKNDLKPDSLFGVSAD